MMISYPFTSKLVTDTGGNSTYDRTITAEMERAFNKMRYTNGVFSSPDDGLKIKASSGMNVTMEKGGCNIEGAMAYNPSVMTYSLSESNASLARIDRFVARFDLNDAIRNIEVYKLEGIVSTTPVATAITTEDNYYEIVLADVKIKAGATEITAADIKDQRLNSDLCGVVIPAIPTPIDTSSLFTQYQDALNQYLAIVAAAIDETLAGQLQNNIDNIWDTIYPVGCIYSSTVATSPATLFGGTWEQIKDKFLLSAGDTYVAGSTGGEATHKLTINEMPSHKHTDANVRSPIAFSSGRTAAYGTDGSFIQNSELTKSRGGDDAHNNMPPYEVVYNWKRTA